MGSGCKNATFLMFHLIKYLSVAAVLAAFLSSLSVASSTGDSTNYKPPKDNNTRRQVRKAGGSRGCNLPLDNTVTLLVPQDHLPTTVAERPIFFWYLPRQLSLPVRFTLLEPGKKPLLVRELNPSPGIVALKFPSNIPTLEIGKTYRWTVTVVCNPKKPSRNLFAQAWIKRVYFPSNGLMSSLTGSDGVVNSENCRINYAQAGIWYDALACSYSRLMDNPHNSPEEVKIFWSLLKQVNLGYIVKKKPILHLY